MARKITFDDVETVHTGDDILDDGARCCACGDRFEDGSKVVMVPLLDPESRMVAPSHDHCAVMNNEIDVHAPSGATLTALRGARGTLAYLRDGAPDGPVDLDGIIADLDRLLS